MKPGRAAGRQLPGGQIPLQPVTRADNGLMGTLIERQGAIRVLKHGRLGRRQLLPNRSVRQLHSAVRANQATRVEDVIVIGPLELDDEFRVREVGHESLASALAENGVGDHLANDPVVDQLLKRGVSRGEMVHVIHDEGAIPGRRKPPIDMKMMALETDVFFVLVPRAMNRNGSPLLNDDAWDRVPFADDGAFDGREFHQRFSGKR
jgi:hypothetical protein